MQNHETNGSSQYVVLHIEHDDHVRRLVQSALEPRADIRLVAASRGKLGLELAQIHRPTVVLLDMGLPDINGDVVLDSLRNDPVTRTAFVIVVSSEPAHGRLQHLVESRELGYLTKPFESRDLVDAIDELLVAPERQSSPQAYGALVPVLPPVAMAPSGVLSDLLHAVLGATTRAFENAHGLLELMMPI
jgi:CheY-like chemotaxis protein